MGLNDVCDSIMKLPELPGGKKIVYSQKDFPITDVALLDESDEFQKTLKEIIARHDGLWNAEAEQYFLNNCKDI